MEAPMVSLLERRRHQRDTIALAPSDVPTVEIAWRDGPTPHPTAERPSADPRIRIVSGPNSPEIPVPELKQLAWDHSAAGRPSLGRRMIRAVARFCIPVVIGIGATLAWQSHGDQASETIKTWAASLGQRWIAAPETRSAAEITPAATQTAIPVQAAAQDVALAQPRPDPQIPPASAGQAAPAAASMQQLDAVARNLAVVQKSVEQLGAKQEEMARNIASLQAAEQDIRKKLSPAPQTMVVPLPPRKKIVADAPAQAASPSSVEPSRSPQPTPVMRPPVSIVPSR
jgi:hypothetical protein